MLNMNHSCLVPGMVPTYQADVPLRLIDPGKWSDVRRFLELLGGGKVFNICGRLRVWGSSDLFSGVRVNAQLSEPTVEGGMVTVWAGADPCFNATSTVNSLSSGTFDHKELALCTLSTIDFSRIAPCDINITVLSPIFPGASLGTSAALGVAINRAFLGAAFNPLELALRALKAELEICDKATGNQDHISVAYGSAKDVNSPAIMINVRDLYDVDVTRIPVGPLLSTWMRNIVVMFLGGHDSSEIHRELGIHLDASTGRAKTLLTSMRDTADMTRSAFESDDPTLFLDALSAVYQAQQSLSHRLVSDNARVLIERAMVSGGASIVPGAGGIGGSVVSCFGNRQNADNYVDWAKSCYPEVRFYEAQCPGIK
ncbi:MAG: hypothetical protein WCG99_02650 [Candidatus Berkelbacteria bacterium]